MWSPLPSRPLLVGGGRCSRKYLFVFRVMALAERIEPWAAMASLLGLEALEAVQASLSKHRGDGKVKLGRGPYTISMAILSMHAGFQHPRTKCMIAPNILLFFMCFFMWFYK